MDDEIWVCLKCGHENWLSVDDLEGHGEVYECEKCGKKHYLEIHYEFEPSMRMPLFRPKPLMYLDENRMSPRIRIGSRLAQKLRFNA